MIPSNPVSAEQWAAWIIMGDDFAIVPGPLRVLQDRIVLAIETAIANPPSPAPAAAPPR